MFFAQNANDYDCRRKGRLIKRVPRVGFAPLQEPNSSLSLEVGITAHNADNFIEYIIDRIWICTTMLIWVQSSSRQHLKPDHTLVPKHRLSLTGLLVDGLFPPSYQITLIVPDVCHT